MIFIPRNFLGNHKLLKNRRIFHFRKIPNVKKQLHRYAAMKNANNISNFHENIKMKKTSEFTPSQTRVEHVAAAGRPATQSAEMPASKPNIFRRLLQILFLANLNVQHVHS